MDTLTLGAAIAIAKSIPGTAGDRAVTAQEAAEAAQAAAEQAASTAMNYGHSVSVENGILIISNSNSNEGE